MLAILNMIKAIADDIGFKSYVREYNFDDQLNAFYRLAITDEKPLLQESDMCGINYYATPITCYGITPDERDKEKLDLMLNQLQEALEPIHNELGITSFVDFNIQNEGVDVQSNITFSLRFNCLWHK